MPRKRAPSTPKRTPKKSRKGKQKELPGGALEMSFQLDGMYSELVQSPDWLIFD